MRVLYLEKRGGNNAELSDIKNYRVSVLEDINTNIHGSMYFEFGRCDRWTIRTTNKRTGAPLKKSVKELVKADVMHIDTSFYKPENGGKWFSCWRDCDMEQAVFDELLDYNRKSILYIVNKYAVNHFDKVAFIDEEAQKIINTCGGYREKSILDNDPVFTKSDTWNENHKIIKVYSRVNHQLNNSCEVDLITRKITG